MTSNPIRFCKGGKYGGYSIDPDIFKDWVVKIPVKSHTIKRSGTCALDFFQQSELKDKKGVCFIDKSVRGYFLIPTEILKAHFIKRASCEGVKDALYVYDVKAIVEKGLVPMHGSQVQPKLKSSSRNFPSEIRTFIRYPNRKLYDREESRYVDNHWLISLAKEGVNFQILEHGTHLNVTKKIMMHAFLYAEEFDQLAQYALNNHPTLKW